MITIIFYGLDQFVVGQLSKQMTPGLAKLYEVNEDQINFVAPNDMVFHKGVEQTSWNLLIHVHAPMKVSVLQDLVLEERNIDTLAIGYPLHLNGEPSDMSKNVIAFKELLLKKNL